MLRRLVCLLPAIALLATGFLEQGQAGLFKKKSQGCGCEAGPCDACAGGHSGDCGCAPAVADCAPAMQTRTVMVPTYVTEMRTITATEYRQEQRQRNYTVTKRVPVNEQREVNYTVMVPQQ